MNIVKSLPPFVPYNKFVSFDVEVFQMNSKQLHRPNSGHFACLTMCPNETDVYIIFDEQDVPEALSRIQAGVWVAHRAKFDITQLRRYAEIKPFKKLWDTQIVERVMWNGYYDGFAMADLARRYLNVYVDKTLQKSFETAYEMTEPMIEYACLDALYERQIAIAQREIIEKEDFNVYANIDRPTMWAIMDFYGFAINVDKWTELAETNLQRRIVIDDKLPFNPRSPKQVKPHLIKKGFKGLPTTGVGDLKKWMGKYPDTEAFELAQLTVESRMYGTRASRYGAKFIENFLEHDNRVPVIYANFDTNKAETGRMASSSPNMQNIPARDTKEFRECFIARPGNKLIISDWSAQEPRIVAYVSQDKRMIEIFKNGQDIYIELGRDVYGQELTKHDPRRADMKSNILGVAYGLSKYGLSEKLQCSTAEASELLQKTFRIIPDAARWGNQQAEKRRLVHTINGRKAWLNPYSYQCANNARNSPIQGSAADMMKKVIVYLHENWKFDCPFGIVAPIHDELILDVPEPLAPEIAKFTSDVMVQVAEEMCPGVPFIADATIADDWSKK